MNTKKNIYIEGDNLDALKLLQETYLDKIKMNYIDPPYNTWSDAFVYDDDRFFSSEEFSDVSGQYDDNGNMLFDIRVNNESNERFHTDWLNMMYPRLRIAKNFLCDDGVILISIDDNEVENLKNISNEVFGKRNHLVTLIWNKQHSQQHGIFKRYHESILVYAKNIDKLSYISGGEGIIVAGAQKKISKDNPESSFTFPPGVRFDAPDETCITGTYGISEKSTIVSGRLMANYGKTTDSVTISAGWSQKNQMKDFFAGKDVVDSRGQRVLEFYFTSRGKLMCRKERKKITPSSLLPEYGMVSKQSEALAKLMGGNIFDSPKPVEMIEDFGRWFLKDGDIVLDFFSGSATTAHAIMQLNAEDDCHRKFIMIQLPEVTDEKSEARKADYDTICDIGEERIRRAGKKIHDKNPSVDVGFKVFKLGSSSLNKRSNECGAKS